jgi:serine protease Do
MGHGYWLAVHRAPWCQIWYRAAQPHRLVYRQSQSAAERAGVQPGDLLLAINQEAVTSVEQARTVADRSGRSVALLVMRDGSRLFVPLRLTSIPMV